MASLSGKAPGTTFKDLLHIYDGDDNEGLVSALKTMFDGDGAATNLQLSTANVNINNHNGSTGLMLNGTLVTSSAAEINKLNGLTPGTVTTAKFVLVDSNKDISGFRNITASGTITAANFIGTGNVQIGDAPADTIALNATITTNLIFEGSSANDYELTLSPGNPTADRTLTLPNETGTIATQAHVTTQVNNLIDSAPSALDTLNELAAALNDDANFGSTVTTSLATKAPIASPTFTGTLTTTGSIKVDATSGNHGVLELEAGTGNKWSVVSSVASNNLDFYHETPGTVLTITRDTARVGIGTTSPSNALSVSGGIEIVGNAEFNGSGEGLYHINNNGISIATNGSPRLTILNDGKTGIGTTSPSAKLESVVTTNGDIALRIGGVATSTAVTPIMDFRGSGQLKIRRNNSDILMAGDGANDDTHLYTMGTQRLTIKGDTGSLGIGTNSPSTKLHVASGAIRLDSSQQLQFGGSATHIDGDSGYMAIDVNSAERMRITSAGNIGIGTTSPDSLMEIESSGSTGHTLSMKNTSTNANAKLKIDFLGNDGVNNNSKGYIQYNNANSDIEINSESELSLQTDGTTRMIVKSDGKVGIGTTDIDYELDVQGSIRIADAIYGFHDGPSGRSYARKWIQFSPNVLHHASHTDREITFYADQGTDKPILKVGGGSGYTRRVGINTYAPEKSLHIAQLADDDGIRLSGYDNMANRDADIYLDQYGQLNIKNNVQSDGLANAHINIATNQGGAVYMYPQLRVGNDGISTQGAVDLKIGGTYDSDIKLLNASGSAVLTVDAGTSTTKFTGGSAFDTSSVATMISSSVMNLVGSDDMRILFTEGSSTYRGQIGYEHAGSTYIGIWDSGSSSVPSLVSQGGKIGIGTTSPSAKLDVAGDANIDTKLWIGNTHTSGQDWGSINTKGNELVIDGGADSGLTIVTGASNSGYITHNNYNDGDYQWIKFDSANAGMSFKVGGTENVLALKSTGLNIGNVTATSSGGVANSASLRLKGIDLDEVVWGAPSPRYANHVWKSNSSNLELVGRTFGGSTITYGKMILGQNASDLHQIFGLGGSNVGIGTETPSANTKLDVNGAIQSTTFYVGGEPYQGTIAYNGNGNIVHEPRASYDINFLLNSNEGISISDSLLASAGTDVGGTTKDLGGLPFHFKASEPNFIIDSNYNTSGIWWGGGNAGSNLKLLSANYASQVLEFNSWNDDASAKKSDIFAIDGNNGRIGIGTASPTHLLSLTASDAYSLIKFKNSSASSGGEFGLEGVHGFMWNRESSGHLYFGTNSTTRMTITASGHISLTESLSLATSKILFFDGGDNTFIRENGADTLQFYTGGSNALTINASQNVGIGTTPTEKLHVLGNFLVDNTYPTVTMKNGSTFFNEFKIISGNHTILKTSSANFDLVFGTADVERMRLKGSNLGIGTTSPQSLVHIEGNTPILQLRETSGTSEVGISFNHSTGGSQYNWFAGTQDGDVRKFQIGATVTNGHSTDTAQASNSLLTINQNGGLVGIGTSSPTFGKLQVNPGSDSTTGLAIWGANDGIKIQRANGSNDGAFGQITFTTNDWIHLKTYTESKGIGVDMIGGTNSGINPANNYIQFNGYDKIFSRLGTTQMTMGSGKVYYENVNVGIGETSPTHLLEVKGHVAITDGYNLFMKRDGSSLRFTADGKVGGTNHGEFYMSADGTMNWTIGGTNRMSLTANGPSVSNIYTPSIVAAGGDSINLLASGPNINIAADYDSTAGQINMFPTGKNLGTGATVVFHDTHTDFTNKPLRFAAASDPSAVTDNCHLYAKDVSSSAELFAQDEAGNVTQISPHDENGEWVFNSKNIKTKIRKRIRMEKLIRKLEDYFGEQFIEEILETT